MVDGVVYPRKKSKAGWIVGGIVALLALLCVGGSAIAFMSAGAGSSDAVNGQIPLPAATERSGSKPAKPVAKVKTTIPEGNWVVGKEVAAGEYRTEGAAPGVIRMCSWTVRKGPGLKAEVVDVGSVQGAEQPGRVRLDKGLYFETSGCEDWARQ
jgi:hypothetical protein